MTAEEYELRRQLAEMVLGEPLAGWWVVHDPTCPEPDGGYCNCLPPIWFSGLTRTVCVLPDLEVDVHPIH